jgi:hypothetical protein
MNAGVRYWGAGLRGRLAVAVALAVALYGLIAGGGKSVVPLAAKTTAAIPNAGYSVSMVAEPNGSGHIDVVALGANHSLDAYWNIGTTWYGPLSVNGVNTTFSAPALAADDHGNLNVAVEGPSNSLWVYWEAGGTWYGPLGLGGTGTAFSTPAIATEDGTVDVSVEGPNHSLLFFWEVSGTWYGPYGVAGTGTTYSAPSVDENCINAGTLCRGGGNHFVTITAQGPSNDLRAYQSENGTWTATPETGPDFVLSPQATRALGTGFVSWVEGAGNSLTLFENNSSFGTGSSESCQVAGAGTTFSAPGAEILDGDNTIAVVGPDNSLRIFWYSTATSDLCASGNANGPLGIGAANSAFSVPSIVEANTDNIAVEGPSNSLWVFWDSNGTWYGPLGIGAAGSTFTSPN